MYSFIALPLQRLAIITQLLVVIFLFAPSKISAQDCGGLGHKENVTSQGTEFLLCFMQNETQFYPASIQNYQDIYLASAGASATVTITCKAFPGWSNVIFLEKDSSFVYHLSTDPVIGANGSDAIIEDEDTINPTVFRVIATTPIACYGMNNKVETADAFLALPRNVASTEYRVMSYYNSTLGSFSDSLEYDPSEFCVAAFDSNTTVTIIPEAITLKGKPAHVPLTYVLNSGEAVQIQAALDSPSYDMTGSIVRSNKPIVVYGGHRRAEVPVGVVINNQGNLGTSRDHLCEAMPPLSDWGYSFVAKNFGRADGDILRVLASVDNTVVKINGKVWGKPLNANQFRDTLIPLSDFAINNIVAVETDSMHLILVGMIAHTAPDGVTGDPFLAIVPPLNQTYTDFTYFLSTDITQYNPNQQYLIVVTDSSRIDNIQVDGNPLPGNLFTNLTLPLNGGKHYSATTLQQPGGIHHISSPGLSENGFTILAYGWGVFISYGYTAGALLKPIAGIMSLSSPTPGIAPYPGDTSRNLPPPSITIRNILTERVYFDSAKFTYSQNPQKIAVRLKNDIATGTGTIEMAEEKTLELVTAKPVQETITGNVRIWYHSSLWMDMFPVDFPFTITPQQSAGVTTASAQIVLLENYPNPASGKTTVHFRIPSRAYVSVKIYDALGRVVRTVTQSVVNSSDQQMQVITKGIPAGSYTLELLSPELGISEHRQLIIVE